jgi:predicted nucleotide-binding protein
LVPLDKNAVPDPDSADQLPLKAHRAFVVHGHDVAFREAVARFLERVGIQPIVLHEQASEGRTIAEKLDHYSDVDFAVVLLTPDDVGGLTGISSDGLRSRPRQNAILELGYFTGKLGRNRVCAMHRGSLELPSDHIGVVYIALDDAGAWRLQLGRELRAAGMPVDLNLAVQPRASITLFARRWTI